MTEQPSLTGMDGLHRPNRYPFNVDHTKLANHPLPEAEQPTKSHTERALGLVEDIRTRPLTDDQAIELAKVYALLGLTEALTQEQELATPTTQPSAWPSYDH